MNLILPAYLLALVYISAQRDRRSTMPSLRAAWIWFAMIPISHFVFTLFRAGSTPNVRDLALVEIWADGFAWLFLGISMLCLTSVVDRGCGNEPATKD